MTHTQRVSLVALPISCVALVVGLLALSVHPVWGVLVLLGAMGASLQLVAGLCGVQEFGSVRTETGGDDHATD